MNEPLLERIRQLERVNRRWKRATLGLAAVVVLLLGLWAALGIHLILDNLPGVRERARQAEMEAMMQRDRAEVAHQQALQALEAAEAQRRQAELAAQAAKAQAQQRENP
jgi:hypothetical protein